MTKTTTVRSAAPESGIDSVSELVLRSHQRNFHKLHIWRDGTVAMGGVWSLAAVGRTPWGSKNFLPVLFYGSPRNVGKHRPTVIRSTEIAEKNGHPTPKPLGWITWAMGLGSAVGELVLDPFMGSGTTLVAAKLLGRKAIGIEIEKRYCDIAIKRLSAIKLTSGQLEWTLRREAA